MNQENNIEFIKNNDRATAYFTQGKYISKIKKLATVHEDCEVYENNDGSILAHFPVKWVKISPPRKVSEEQKIKAAERLKAYHEQNPT